MPQFNEGNVNSYLVPSSSLTGSLSNSGTLTGQIATGSGGGTTDYNDLSNKPQINSVTLSGNKTTSDLNISYNDLDDKPTIPAAQVNSDWNAESGVAEILNKPTIPAAQVNSDWNAESGVAEILNKPTIPAAQVNSDWNAESGVAQILNKPTIPAAQVNSDWNAASGVAEILNKPTLATVATSGSYNDLTDKPVEATSISVTASSDMPASFPVPDVCRRGKVVIARFNVNMPARTYLTTETIWNFSKKPVIITNFTVTNILGDTIPMFIHSTDGKVRFSNQRTLNAASYFLGELVYLTDED